MRQDAKTSEQSLGQLPTPGAEECRAARDRYRGSIVNRSRLWSFLGPMVLTLGLGCSIGPKNFKALSNPAAIVRARSVAYGDNLPEWRVVPPLIERLNDTDPVVRLSAHEELRKRTGQDFGYVPWAPPGERRPAVKRWQKWWEGRKAALASKRQIP